VEAAVLASEEPLVEQGSALARAVRRRPFLWAWAVVVVIWIAVVGVPTSRPQVFAIIGVGLIASCTGERSAWKRVVLDWAPLYFILTLYDTLRGLAGTWLEPHALDQIAFDKWMFGGTVPTVFLQHTFYTPGVAHVWDYIAFFVYLSHFFAAFLVAAWLWKFSYERFRRFATLFVGLTFAGFITYALYPAMPPWLASRTARLQPTAKIIDEMWSHIGLSNGKHVFSGTGQLANPIAAVPSLHAAYPMLLALFFWKTAGRRRWLLAAYVLAMAVTLVYTGEHYVVDIFLGWLYAAVVYFGGSRVLDRLGQRRRARAAAAATA